MPRSWAAFIAKLLPPSARPAAASARRSGRRFGQKPLAKPDTADRSENVLTTVAATAGSKPRSIRWGAWCRLTPAWTGKISRVNRESSKKAGVRSAWARVKEGSRAGAAAACADIGRATCRERVGKYVEK